MTYNRLKATVTGLLTGDNMLPEDPEVLLGLLEMSFSEIATHAKAMRLMTLYKGDNIARATNGNYYIRYPEVPVEDTDELDLDNELCFPVARFIASYVSDRKGPAHYAEGRRLIREYNSKVDELLGRGEQ